MITTCGAVLASSNVKPLFALTLLFPGGGGALILVLLLLGVALLVFWNARGKTSAPAGKPAVSTLTACGGSHIGGRKNNEDAFLVKGQLFVIADGMGGQACGEVASNSLIAAFDQCEQSPCSNAAPPDWFRFSVLAANASMRDLLVLNPACAGFGTTVVAARRNGNKIEFGWSGDSHFFRLRGGVLERLTVEHSLAVKLFEQGVITEEQIATHRFKNTLYRCVGGTLRDPEWDQSSFEIEPGDIYLLCSDGLVDYSDIKRVQQILAGPGTPEEKVADLIAMAVADATGDNATAIVIEAN